MKFEMLSQVIPTRIRGTPHQTLTTFPLSPLPLYGDYKHVFTLELLPQTPGRSAENVNRKPWHRHGARVMLLLGRSRSLGSSRMLLSRLWADYREEGIRQRRAEGHLSRPGF